MSDISQEINPATESFDRIYTGTAIFKTGHLETAILDIIAVSFFFSIDICNELHIKKSVKIYANFFYAYTKSFILYFMCFL